MEERKNRERRDHNGELESGPNAEIGTFGCSLLETYHSTVRDSNCIVQDHAIKALKQKLKPPTGNFRVDRC
jgi:hypothetical protein